ncbi:MAG: AIPR family protein [Patescibacteria group bacterium]
MNLRQQIIADRIEALAKKTGITDDEAFTRYVHSLVLGISTTSFNPDDVVDGGQDKQIDTVAIDENEDSAEVYISQITTSDSFSSNKLIQLANGLKWMFEADSKELSKLTNQLLLDKIRQFREIRVDKGPSNMQVHVRFISNGDSKDISDEFNDELQRIRDQYDNDTFEAFSIKALGCDELTDLSKMWERRSKKADSNLKIKYDKNNPSYIRYDSKDLKGVVCSVPALEIANLVNGNPDGSIFDLNIRQYLGSRGKVNKDILDTSTSDESYKFWFLNNGITIVCDSFDAVPDHDRPQVKLKNLQIVNGCQTATSIAAAQKLNLLKRDVYVITRIYETKDHELVSRIVLTTNNQNQITSRNLRANDPIQIDMEKAFKILGYYYERKPRQYENEDIDINKVFDNEFVGQAYMGVVLKNPAEARARRYRIWGDMHNKVFSGRDKIEPYIFSTLLSTRISQWLRKSEHYNAKNTTERVTARRGLFHIARIASYLIRGEDSWSNSTTQLKKKIKTLDHKPEDLETIFEKAFQDLLSIVKTSDYKEDLERGFKAAVLDKSIDRKLHKTQ